MKSLRRDLTIALLVGVAAAVIGFRHVTARYVPDEDANPDVLFLSGAADYYLQDVLSPCVKRFGFEPQPSQTMALPEWRAFVTRKLDVFPCSAIQSIEIVPVDYFSTLHRHLHRTMAWVFAITGPRLIGFAYYQAIAVGVFMALLYGVFRLGMGPVLAVLLLVPMAFSPRHLEVALQPLEYAKAAPFAACVLGVGILLCCRLSRRAAAAVALATGCAVGIGFGFKTDVMLYGPFGALALLLFFRDHSGRPGTRWIVLALYAAGALAAGAPLVRAHFFGEQRSLVPAQILGGLTPGFAAEYAQPALYDYGLLFDDGYSIAQINSFNQRVNGSTEFGNFYSKAIQRGAFGVVFAIERVFPSDTILRLYADILQILEFAPGGLVAALIVVLGLFFVDRRLALALLFVLAYMVGYVSLVFSPKHYFHLEFVSWWFLGCAAASLLAIRRWHFDPAWRASLATLALVVAAAFGALWAARLYQDRQVRTMFDTYTDPAQFEVVEPSAIAARALRESDPDKIVTDYVSLLITCRTARAADVVAVYRAPVYWRHGLTVPCEREGQRWNLLWPIYQRAPEWIFGRFETSGGAGLSIDQFRRTRSLERYSLLPRLRLPDGWQQRDLHLTLLPALLSPTRIRPKPQAFPTQPGPLPPPPKSWSPFSTPATDTLAHLLPRLNTWIATPGVSVATNGALDVVQGTTGQLEYQLMSEPIPVPPHTTLIVRVHGEVERGRVGLGVLEGSQQHWVLPPNYERSDFKVDTGANDHVRLVFANMNQPADGEIRTRFAVRSVTYDIRSSVIDRVTALLWPER